MAKTTSQIIAENKKKRAEEAAIDASRNAIHQRQMAEVGAKSAAKTAAVLKNAGIKTTTNPNTYEVNVVGDHTPRSKDIRQRLNVQKKKEDAIDSKYGIDSEKIKRDRTKKQYEDYVNSEEYRKKQAESVRELQREMDKDESRVFAPTSDFSSPAPQDEMEARLRREKDRAEAAYNASEDRKTMEAGRAEIDAMPEEDLALLDSYVRNRDNRQDVFVNDISWFLSNKKENDALKALTEKYGEDKALQLAEIYGMNLHEQNAKAAEEQGKAGVNDSWISATAHNLLGIPARAFGNISGFTGRLSAEANRTGQFHGLPQYTAGDELSAYGNAVTGQTAQNIEGDVYDENGNLLEDGGALRKVASWGYQGAMSIADSTARLAMSGGNSAIASAVAGMGTFNQSVQKYSAMGASPEQAYTAATMSAGIEYITEKLPMDEALKLLHSGGDAGVVKKVLTQAFLVEPSSEELNLFANIAMEAKVLGEKSGKEQRIGDLIAGGLTRDQAEQQFWKETWMEALETYAVSAFAGLLGGGIAAYAGNQTQAAQEQQQMSADPAAQVQQEVQPPVPTEAELAQLAMEDTVAGLQETAPTAAPEAPMTEPQQSLQMAMEDLMGGQEQPEAVGDNLTATASSPQTEDSGTMPAEGGQIPTKGEKDGQRVLNGFASSDFRNSNTYMNTGLQNENANIRAGYQQELRENPDAAKYEVKHNADTLAEAQRRTGSPEKNAAALEDLLNKEHWTPEDVATSTLLLDEIMASGDKDAIHQLNALRQKRKEAGTYFGQGAQSFAINNPTMKAADSPATAVDAFHSHLDGLKQEETTWNKKSGVDFETWKNQIKEDVDRIGIEIASVEEGDSDAMRQIIRQIAQRRGTTALFGTSQNLTGNAWSVLKKLDFQDLKKVANTQLVAMADDYRARSAGEVAKGLRKQSMLSSLKTFVRNIGGNGVGGFADSLSESGAGRMADAVLSKFTGKQTMGSDILRASDYAKAAREAGQFASLCVELNIPIETDADSSYSAAAGNSGNNKYLGKTFRATGNPAMRALYAYQKYMSYALEVTDKIFEGGTNAAVAESLNRLQGANLTEEEISALADFTGNRRTFKDATWKEDGKIKGAELSRLTASLKNAGGDTKAGKVYRALADYKVPFDKVPMNVTQTGIDYTTGVVKSIGEMIGIIKDANAGKTIPVERQRQAASDFGRGITGVGMIALFAAAAAKGVLRASDTEDRDKEALAQAEGRSGAQINWDALARGLEDGDAEWKDGDTITSLDFLEPFNTQMYLGYEIAQSEDINLLNYTESTIKSVFNSMMDSPAFTGLSGLVEDVKDLFDAFDTDGFGGVVEEFGNVIAKNAGDYVSTYIPQWIRQTAQDMDGYYRDTRGQTAAETAVNKVKSSVPWLSKKLPVKYSGLGEAQKRGSAVETFLDPTATHAFQQNEVTTFLDELSSKVGESANNIYPDRQAPMKFTYGDDREVTLDGQMRETYQKTYGEKVSELYTSLIHDQDFQGFSDELKIKALEEAKGYATRYAKAAVSDYREAPIGTVEALAKGIVQREVKSQMDAFFTDLDTQREYGYSTEETAAKLEESYQAFTGLSKDTQKEILEQATSDTAKYLEVRQKGVTTEQYLRTTQKLDGLKVQPTYGGIRPAQQWQAIADMVGMSDSAKDTLMKAYMEDYDPNVKGSDTVELKYDYARQELDMSASEFALAYDIYSHEKHVGGDGTADRTRERMERELGITKAEAKQLYKLYGGYWKPWKE